MFSCFVLRSSYITNSHKFKLSSYHGKPFLCDDPLSSYYCFDYMRTAMEDVECFENIIKKHFIRVFSYEIEEVRRYFMDILYQRAIVFFRLVVQSLEDMDIDKRISVFYGEEMGEIELISFCGQ